jgi:enolase-phosphatase E1
MRRWHAEGLELAVFSSGSVTIQEPWFRKSPDGDLAALMSGYFDTVNAGPKREPASYRTIAARLAEDWGAAAGDLLFLSDVPAELDAAADAGWQTVGVRRPGEPFGEADFGAHPTIASFADLLVAAAVRQ